MHIQCLIVDKKISFSCSYMSLCENNDNPHDERRLAIADFFDLASHFAGHDKAAEVEAKAAEIMESGIRNKDAIHIACAIVTGSDFFITTDDDLTNRYAGEEIHVCGPIDFIKVLEERHE